MRMPGLVFSLSSYPVESPRPRLKSTPLAALTIRRSGPYRHRRLAPGATVLAWHEKGHDTNRLTALLATGDRENLAAGLGGRLLCGSRAACGGGFESALAISTWAPL